MMSLETEKHQIELFDQQAAAYVARHNPHYLNGRIAFFLSRMVGRAQGRILEIGTGVGLITRLLEQTFPHCEVYGMDYSAGMIRQRLFARAAVGDAEQLHFIDTCFDWIIASDVIEHVDHPERMIAEAARCLKPGGRLLLTTPNPLFVPVFNLAGRLGLSLSSEKLLDLRLIKRLFARHGLHVVVEQATNPAFGTVLAMVRRRALTRDPLLRRPGIRRHCYFTRCFELRKAD